MPDRAMVKFETDVDKLVATWVKDVNAVMNKCQDAVYARTDALVRQITALQGPASAKPDEVGTLVNRLLNEDAQSLKKVIAVEFGIKQDPKTGKLSNHRIAYRGTILDLG
jgi:hypothetical protein